MILVELTNPDGVQMMQAFARTYPWDWAADIGEVPPRDLTLVGRFRNSKKLQKQTLSEVTTGQSQPSAGYAAAVVDPKGNLIAKAGDQRGKHGGNPTYSAPMIAMGEAGSSVNLRECVPVFVARSTNNPVGIVEFGHSSLGACELFRPAAVLSNVTFDAGLKKALGEAQVKVIDAR